VIRVKRCIRLRVSKERLENQNTYNFWRKSGELRENPMKEERCCWFQKNNLR